MIPTLWPQVMLDLETLSSRRDAPIVQIGAVCFDIRQRSFGPGVSLNVTPDFKLTPPSFDTVMWWMGQGEEVKERVFREEGRLPPWVAIEKLRELFSFHCKPDVEVWAMPPEFDCVILQNTVDSIGGKPLWRFDKTRDLRTLEALAGGVKAARFPSALPHDALEDARAQAMTACRYYHLLTTRAGAPRPVGPDENIGSLPND